MKIQLLQEATMNLLPNTSILVMDTMELRHIIAVYPKVNNTLIINVALSQIVMVYIGYQLET